MEDRAETLPCRVVHKMTKYLLGEAQSGYIYEWVRIEIRHFGFLSKIGLLAHTPPKGHRNMLQKKVGSKANYFVSNKLHVQ